MRIKIKDSTKLDGTPKCEVIDLDTGEEIPLVTNITYNHKAGLTPILLLEIAEIIEPVAVAQPTIEIEGDFERKAKIDITDRKDRHWLRLFLNIFRGESHV